MRWRTGAVVFLALAVGFYQLLHSEIGLRVRQAGNGWVE
jgi:hypothetical protein